MPGISDQQDDPPDAKVPLLGRDPPFQGLDVGQSRLRFDHDADVVAVDDDVRAAKIAEDRDRDLCPPPEARRDSSPQSGDEVEVPRVPKRRADRVQADPSTEAKDGSGDDDANEVEVCGLAALDATDRRMRRVEHPRQRSLAQSGDFASDAQLGPDAAPLVSRKAEPASHR